MNMAPPAAVSFQWLSQHGDARKAAVELGRAAKQMATRGYQYEQDQAKEREIEQWVDIWWPRRTTYCRWMPTPSVCGRDSCIGARTHCTKTP
ncbi:MAG: hypothetical protein ABI040_00715 [Rhodoferax sp.]